MKNAYLIAPSAHLTKSKLNQSINTLKEWGFNIKYSNDITKKFYYFAGNNIKRAKEINDAYNDKETEIIFCARGGKGAIQILPLINFKKIKKTNKILVGFSDITILLNAINQITGRRCIHGPFPNKKLKDYDKKTISSLFDVIKKKDYKVKIKNKDILMSGVSRGEIVGGTIRTFVKSLGTHFEISTKNKIIFFEQNSWTGRDIYDALWQLKLAGKFKECRGIILGHFTKVDKNINSYLKEFFKDFKVPVIINQPIGHGEPNLSVPIGETCMIDTKSKYWGIKF